jgi:hypothetical protein
MRPPDRYSASPLPSFCTITTRSTPSFADALRMIWSWSRGKRRPVSLKRQIAEARAVAEIADALEADARKRATAAKNKRA